MFAEMKLRSHSLNNGLQVQLGTETAHDRVSSKVIAGLNVLNWELQVFSAKTWHNL